MRSGMKMMAVNEMRRRRDSRGRYMEGGGQMEMGYGRMEGGGRNRMEGGNTNRMGGYDRMESEMRGGMETEMRRGGGRGGNRSEGGNSNRMEEGGASSHYWPGPHIPPYGDGEPEMRGGRGGERRNAYDESPSMGGYGGFVWNEGGGENRMEGGSNIVDMRQYGRRYNPDRARMAMGGQKEPMQQRMIGFASNKGDEEHLSREEAEKWVESMESEDGRKGGRWPYHEIKQYAGNFGIQGEEKVVEFFAVMNALATDYGKVAKKHGVDKVEFWADLAKAFINDKDANPGKVKMYYECIAKKEDE